MSRIHLEFSDEEMQVKIIVDPSIFSGEQQKAVLEGVAKIVPLLKEKTKHPEVDQRRPKWYLWDAGKKDYVTPK